MKMTAALYLALTMSSCGIATAMAASPTPLGDPFHIRYGESVELAGGVKLKFSGVNEHRCPIDVTCVSQGEAQVEFVLQVKGRSTRGSIDTRNADRRLLAHRVKLLGLHPWPRQSEQRSAQEYVATLRITDAPPHSPKPVANRATALAEAGRYVDAYARSAKLICGDWRERGLASYVEDNADLCRMIAKLSGTAHAVSEGEGGWAFFFMIEDPQMRTQANEPLYLVVSTSKAPKDAFDRVHGSDFATLPCGVTLLVDAAYGGCNAPTH
jgi:hypothetical protein